MQLYTNFTVIYFSSAVRSLASVTLCIDLYMCMVLISCLRLHSMIFPLLPQGKPYVLWQENGHLSSTLVVYSGGAQQQQCLLTKDSYRHMGAAAVATLATEALRCVAPMEPASGWQHHQAMPEQRHQYLEPVVEA